MEPNDPRALSGEELETRLPEDGHRRYDAELMVSFSDRTGWSAEFKTFASSSVAPTGVVVLGVEGENSRREALEQFWLGLDTEDDLAEFQRSR